MDFIGKIIIFNYYQFFLELFVALLIMMFTCKKRKYFAPIALGFAILGFGFYYLPALYIGEMPLSYSIVFIAVILVGICLYDVKWYYVIFYACAAYGLQHIAWNLLFIILENAFVGIDLDEGIARLLYFSIFIVIYTGMFVFRYLKPSYFNIEKFNVFSIISSGAIILVVVFLSALLPNYGSWSWVTRIYTILCCLLSLMVMSGFFELARVNNKKYILEKENDQLKNLLSQQAKQQQTVKATIDIINMKIHDLKHQVDVIKNLPEDEKDSYIQDLKKAIDIYGDIAKTGNEVLDIVLTEKGLICSGKNIRFTYICDGEAIKFMNVNDLSSLVGNIIDNAIDAAELEEVDENRFIKLNISNKKGFLCIHEENYCSYKTNFNDGLPLTRMKNDPSHGYGVKSIKFIVDKYNGNTKFTLKNNVFSVNITIPLKGITQ